MRIDILLIGITCYALGALSGLLWRYADYLEKEEDDTNGEL